MVLLILSFYLGVFSGVVVMTLLTTASEDKYQAPSVGQIDD